MTTPTESAPEPTPSDPTTPPDPDSLPLDPAEITHDDQPRVLDPELQAPGLADEDNTPAE